MLIVAQKEPHAGTLAYKEISQPETVAERTKLAKRMKDEFELPMTVLVDSMKDTSRALFTDLPSPAFVIDEKGVVRGKMSWAQPEAISDFLSTMKADSEAAPAKTKSEDSKTPVPSVNETKFLEYSPAIKWVTVSVENQTGSSLYLKRVDFDEVQTVLALGDTKKLKLRVASGYYVLSTEENENPESESSQSGIRHGSYSTRLQWPVPADARFTKTLDLTLSRYEVPKSLRDQWSHIPAGPAVIGDVIGLGRDEERPARIEHVDAFLIGRYEVSNQQYADFLNDQERIEDHWLDLKSRKCLILLNDSPKTAIPKEAKDASNIATLTSARRQPKFVTQGPSKPVVMVSREGALKYCEWLTRKTGVVHRLATEVEWEKAARGPESFLYAYGNICRISAANQESGHLRDSGQFAHNGFGLFDMTGNCFEWVSGDYSTSTKLTGLLRGGSFIFDGIYNRTSFRMRQAPTVMTDDIGFRVVREIPETN